MPAFLRGVGPTYCENAGWKEENAGFVKGSFMSYYVCIFSPDHPKFLIFFGIRKRNQMLKRLNDILKATTFCESNEPCTLKQALCWELQTWEDTQLMMDMQMIRFNGICFTLCCGILIPNLPNF